MGGIETTAGYRSGFARFVRRGSVESEVKSIEAFLVPLESNNQATTCDREILCHGVDVDCAFDGFATIIQSKNVDGSGMVCDQSARQRPKLSAKRKVSR
jgi:hypothetical protein